MRSHILQLCRFLLTTSAILNCRTLPEPFRHQRSQQHHVFKPDQSPESRNKLQLYCSPSHGHLCKGMILQLKKKKIGGNIKFSFIRQAQKNWHGMAQTHHNPSPLVYQTNQPLRPFCLLMFDGTRLPVSLCSTSSLQLPGAHL